MSSGLHRRLLICHPYGVGWGCAYQSRSDGMVVALNVNSGKTMWENNGNSGLIKKIEQILFVPINMKFAKEIEVFVTKIFGLVVVLLVGNIIAYILQLRTSVGKRPVTGLPCEMWVLEM